jgi:hypothetical protein
MRPIFGVNPNERLEPPPFTVFDFTGSFDIGHNVLPPC